MVPEKRIAVFTICFSEGGQHLANREWPLVPRVGDQVSLNKSSGPFEVIRVHFKEEEGTDGLVANVSLRSSAR
jgi:hypothetical protein